MEDVNEAVKAFNCHKMTWKNLCQNLSTIEERIKLPEIVKKSLADPARQADPVVVLGCRLRSYASLVAS